MNHQPQNSRNMNQTPPEIDGWLREFFRQEMPDPWPAAPAVQDSRLAVVGSRRRAERAYPRLALAAAVLLFLGGYWSLAQVFPTPDLMLHSLDEGSGFVPQSAPIGSQLPKVHDDMDIDDLLPALNEVEVPTRNGAATIRWQKLRDGRIFLRVEEKAANPAGQP